MISACASMATFSTTDRQCSIYADICAGVVPFSLALGKFALIGHSSLGALSKLHPTLQSVSVYRPYFLIASLPAIEPPFVIRDAYTAHVSSTLANTFRQHP